MSAETIRYAIFETSLAPMLVAANGRGICCLSFGEGEGELRARFPGAETAPDDGFHDSLFAAARDAVETPAAVTDIPLDMNGTPFQHEVWALLRQIPAGETRTYGDLATMLGKPGASRAVGGANAANRIAVLIPCHRVVPAGGGIGGYAYGQAIKAELLRREVR